MINFVARSVVAATTRVITMLDERAKALEAADVRSPDDELIGTLRELLVQIRELHVGGIWLGWLYAAGGFGLGVLASLLGLLL